MMAKQRKHYTSQEKVAVLRRHLLEHIPVSELCEELGLPPTVSSASASRCGVKSKQKLVSFLHDWPLNQIRVFRHERRARGGEPRR